MRLVLHPKVYSDIDEIMGYYERVATPGLAEEFYTELRYFMTKAADKPESFSIWERDIRRVNLRRFPYHFCSASLATKSGSSSSAITIDIHLLVPGVDRVWPSRKNAGLPTTRPQRQRVASSHQRVVGIHVLRRSRFLPAICCVGSFGAFRHRNRLLPDAR
jgi:hypothetical protein